MFCLICNNGIDYSGCGLKNHLLFIHEVSSINYTLEYLYKNIQPTCACGCGYKTRYTSFTFKKFHVGHSKNRKGIKLTQLQKDKMSISKIEFIKNNPEWSKQKVQLMNKNGRTPEAQQKRMETRWSKEENHQKQSNCLRQRYIDNPQLKQQISTKLKNHYKIPENKEKFHETHNQDWKNKISESISNVYLSGGFEWSKGKYYSTKMKEEFYYRSSWELEHMKLLDCDNNVIRWIYEPFWIKYIKQGEQHRYLPDFLVEYCDGKIKIQEVGPKELKEKKHKEKLSAIKEYCKKMNYEFELISK